MGGKKIWAFAKNKKTSDYVRDENHRLRLFFIWEAQKMKESDPFEYRKIEFMSTQRLESERKIMHVHEGGFFRYNSGQGGAVSTDGDSDSLSHNLAVAAIASLKTLNFTCGDQSISITPITVETEQRVQLIAEGEFKLYIPDIVVTFKESHYWGKRWGNKLVIEIKHTHSCERAKVVDFENHCIPIIEVPLNGMTLETYAQTKTPSLVDIENFYNKLIDQFSKVIDGEILSNPVSLGFHKKKIYELNLSCNFLQNKYEQSQNVVNRLKDVESEHIKTKYQLEEIKEKSLKRVKELRAVADAGESRAIEFERLNINASKLILQQDARIAELEQELLAEKNKGWLSKLFQK